MLLFYRYQVLSDGCLIDNDNGRIIEPLTRRKKKDVPPFHLVMDDTGKTQYFSVKYLMEKLGEGYEEWDEVELPEGYEPIEFHDLSDMSSKERVNALMDLIGD